jgi:hypothetical protein
MKAFRRIEIVIAVALFTLVLYAQEPESSKGKTWVIFVENSNYESFASLNGPGNDVSLMKSALTNYEIDRVIHKKDLTKEKTEEFFSRELKSLIRANNVNSLLLWYAGHGKSIHEISYWIPVDARRDDEQSYYNITNLKQSLLSYTSTVNHVLVVTDACETGPSFYETMRSINTQRDCNKSSDRDARSSQVYSASGYEIAVDNSQFTTLFAGFLINNNNACLPIETIVLNVNTELVNARQPKPKFGKIEGLDDNNGTFFFIGK